MHFPFAGLGPLAVAIPGTSFFLLFNHQGLIFLVSEMNNEQADEMENV